MKPVPPAVVEVHPSHGAALVRDPALLMGQVVFFQPVEAREHLSSVFKPGTESPEKEQECPAFASLAHCRTTCKNSTQLLA